MVRDLQSALMWMPGGEDVVGVVGDALKARGTKPKNRTDEIFADTISRLDPAAAASSLVLGAVISQLAAIPASIALVAAMETQLTPTRAAEVATTGTVFGPSEDLISELELALFRDRQRAMDQLVELAAERDLALDAVAWAVAELHRMEAVVDELRAE